MRDAGDMHQSVVPKATSAAGAMVPVAITTWEASELRAPARIAATMRTAQGNRRRAAAKTWVTAVTNGLVRTKDQRWTDHKSTCRETGSENRAGNGWTRASLKVLAWSGAASGFLRSSTVLSLSVRVHP